MEETPVEDVIATIPGPATPGRKHQPDDPIMEPGEIYLPYPVEETFGGATVFVLDVARYEPL